jgi:predicted phosphodiesterase
LSATHALKVGVISDLHLNLAYNPIIAAGNCG